jgi:hypothetical protein
MKKEIDEELRKEYDARETKVKESIDRIRQLCIIIIIIINKVLLFKIYSGQ